MFFDAAVLVMIIKSVAVVIFAGVLTAVAVVSVVSVLVSLLFMMMLLLLLLLLFLSLKNKSTTGNIF